MDGKNSYVRKVVRSPSLKRKSKAIPISEKVQLERVLGLTATNSASLDTDANTGTIAYPAGCVVVLYNPRLKRQQFIFNSAKKTITCLAFSGDGKHIVTGESGHQPCVRVYEKEDHSWTQICEFQGHKFGISCVAFSPDLKHIVSIGTQHDMTIHVWNWKTRSKVASNKIAAKVTGLAFNQDGNFVTVGNRHVKFWYLDASKSRINETVPLMGRSGLLGEQKNNFFCGVECGKGANAGTTYVITHTGLLCQFNDKRLLDRWVALRTTCANSITVSADYVFIGCADGIVRIFSPHTLHYVTSLPRPHYLGVDIAAAVDAAHAVPTSPHVRYPDVIATRLDEQHAKITCVYNDHSLYVWDVRDIKRIGKSKSFLFHSSCIWGIEVYPQVETGALPAGSFITCSSDDTIRVWNLEQHAAEPALRRNIYSNDLLKTLYCDDQYSSILDIDLNPAGKTDKTDTTFQDRNGVRCLKVSPDGRHLASGDRSGNIRIHDLEFMDQVYFIEAHNTEVLCLQFTKPEKGVCFLSSAGRDRLLHVFDCEQNYGLVQTLDDHSAAITAIAFTNEADTGLLKMISCGADKSILFRNAQMEPEFSFVLNRHLVAKTTLYDMDIDPSEKFVATACQDRNVRIYNIKNGKQKKSYVGSVGSDGTLIRVQLDPSGSLVATSCSDKNLVILDFFTGEVLASMYGHSEIVTGIKFSNDLRHLISVSGDGCIFVWKLPTELTRTMQKRLCEVRHTASPPPQHAGHSRTEAIDVPVIDDLLKTSPQFSRHKVDGNGNVRSAAAAADTQSDYRFSVGHLPPWAKKQVLQEPFSPAVTAAVSGGPAAKPKGRWATSAGNENIVMKSMLDDTTIKLSLHESQVSIITDDDVTNKDEDDDDFRPNFTFYDDEAVSTSESLASYQISDEDENDDDRSKEDEIVYYPGQTNAAENIDASFHVFAGDSNSIADSDAGTEVASSVSDEDESSSRATTPGQEPPPPGAEHTALDNGRFLKDNFEVLSDETSFRQKLVQLEAASVSGLGAGDSQRQSLSARFLSKTQHARAQAITNQPSVVAQHRQQAQLAAQKRRDEMATAMDEPRKRMQTEPPAGGAAVRAPTPGSRRRTIGVPPADDKPAAASNRRSIGPNTSANKVPRKAEVKVPETASRRTIMTRQHSYQMGTTSSQAKLSKTLSSNNISAHTVKPEAQSLDHAGSGSTQSLFPGSSSTLPRKGSAINRKSRLGGGLKDKYKSTPDLVGQVNQEMVIARPKSSVADDMGDMISTSHNYIDMPAARISNNRLLSSTKQNELSQAEADALAMPPPPSTRSQFKAKSSNPNELTLAQAKEILRGKSAAMKKSERAQSMDRVGVRNKSPSRQLPPTPVCSDSTLPVTSQTVLKSSPRQHYNDLNSSLDETPVKESSSPSKDSNSFSRSNVESGHHSPPTHSRPNHLPLQSLNSSKSGEYSQNNVVSTSISSDNKIVRTSSPSKLSRALSPLKSILKGKKHEADAVPSDKCGPAEGEPDILGNFHWKFSTSESNSTSNKSETVLSRSLLSRNREMLTQAWSSPTSSVHSSSTLSSPISTMSNISSPPPTCNSGFYSYGSSEFSHNSINNNNSTSVKSSDVHRNTSADVWPTSSHDTESSAVVAKSKWDKAVQQQQAKYVARSPGSGQKLATNTMYSFASPTHTSVSISLVTSPVVSIASPGDKLIGVVSSLERGTTLAAPETVLQEEDDELKRYDKTRQSPPLSLITTSSDDFKHQSVTLARPADSIIATATAVNGAERPRQPPADVDDLAVFIDDEIQELEDSINQLKDCYSKVKEERPKLADSMLPRLISLRNLIEQIPGCEHPSPPPIESALSEFQEDLVLMMDRLKNRITNMNDGNPPKESTQL